MRRAVITGPTGEIGVALIELLVKNNIEVLAICRPNSKRRKFILESEFVNVIECELEELDSISGTEEKYDVFYHFGWIASYGEERENIRIQQKNLRCEELAVRLAERLGCKRFIGAGSQAEYGRKNVPLTEEMEMYPETLYGMTKYIAGQNCKKLCESLNIEHCWVRVCSVYGPCDGPNTLITYIIKQLYNNEDIELTPCEQIWDYLFSEDAADAFYRIGISKNVAEEYVLGSGEGKPLIRYIEDVQRLALELGKNTRCLVGSKKYSDSQMMYLCTDISKISSDMGFTPNTRFYEGMKKTYQMYKEHNLLWR